MFGEAVVEMKRGIRRVDRVSDLGCCVYRDRGCTFDKLCLLYMNLEYKAWVLLCMLAWGFISNGQRRQCTIRAFRKSTETTTSRKYGSFCGTTTWFTGWEERILVVLVALWKQRKSEIDPTYTKPDHVLDGKL